MADVSTLMSSVQKGARASNSQIDSTYQFGLEATFVLIALSCVIGVMASLFIARGISRSAAAVADRMNVLEGAIGDFTQ